MNEKLKYWRAVAVALLPFALYFIPRDTIFDHTHTLCLVHCLTGEECWGCGMTRALVSLIYFDFDAAWAFHRGVVVVAPLLAWIWVRWIISEVRRVAVSCTNENDNNESSKS